VAYRISIRTTVTHGPETAVTRESERSMAASIDAVAEYLDEMQQHTPEFLGFTLSSDPKAQTALFNMYVGLDDQEKATRAAQSWAVTAITAAGDSTRGWAMLAHPEERERVPA
jgi:hypothetical protein